MAVALQCDHLLESMAIWMQVCVKRQGFQYYEMDPGATLHLLHPHHKVEKVTR